MVMVTLGSPAHAATTGKTAADHHAKALVADFDFIDLGDIAANGGPTVAELESLTDGGNADVEHTHDFAKVITGVYTGDGTTSQVISGLGVTPRRVTISKAIADEGTDYGPHEIIWSTDKIVDDNAAGVAVSLIGTAGGWDSRLNKILAMASGSFTVDDSGGDQDPNANTIVYNFVVEGH